MDFNILFKNLGFSDKESLVYLAALEIAGGSNAKIALKSKLNRVTNYEILKRLIRKGVVSSFKMKGILYFSALDPRVLVKQYKEKLDILENNLPNLIEKIESTPSKPKISFFSQKEGIKKIYDESLLCESKEILTFTNPEQIRDYLGNTYVDEYVADRVRRRIRVKGFAPDDLIGRKEKDEGVDLLRQTHLFPDNYRIFNEIMLFDDKVALFSIKDEMGVIIKNQSIAESLRSVWSMLWDKYGEKGHLPL